MPSYFLNPLLGCFHFRRVTFHGEDAIDQGGIPLKISQAFTTHTLFLFRGLNLFTTGVTKELFTLAIRQLIKDSKIIKPCGIANASAPSNESSSGRFVWFSNNASGVIKSKFVQHLFNLENSATGFPVVRYPFLFSDCNMVDFASCGGVVAQAIARTLGLLIGLASYHNVLSDLPLPSSIYKIMAGDEADVSATT